MCHADNDHIRPKNIALVGLSAGDILDGYPHGYGTGGSTDVWSERFNASLTRIISGNSTAISQINTDASSAAAQEVYDLSERRVSTTDTTHGVYIVKDTTGQKGIEVMIQSHNVYLNTLCAAIIGLR